MDQILQEIAETACLGRNGVHAARYRVSARMLAELEAAGDAMRCINSNGEIAWKATPQLRDHLTDLLLDAGAELEDF